MKKLNLLMVFFSMLLFAACSDNDTNGSNEKDGPKPSMDLAVSPQSDLNYGDNIYVSGLMGDERNLEHYELILCNSAGDTLATKYQMLLGQEFTCNDNIQVPLPKNASTDNLNLQVKLDNTRNGEEVQSFDIQNVGIPEFETLHLILSNGMIVDLIKNGNIYQTPTESVFPAHIKGIISTTTSKSGIWWGTRNGEIASMAKDSITIGGDVEASFTVSFNPVSFDLVEGEHHIWSPIDASDCYYLLGTISGHWMDGEITTERSKMKMNGYESGNDRYYTWTAPEGDDPETGMWGSTAAGEFRLKKGNSGKYILWDGNKIIESSTDDKSKSFPLTAGGPFTIKANFTDGKCSSVDVSGGGKSITFNDGQVIVNGIPMTPFINFSGNRLPIKNGANYIYEGLVSLKNGQTISSEFDLSSFTANPDLFNGDGNATWTLKSISDTYSIRMDLFSGAFYACPTSGYPNVIYMDGWSWAPRESSTAVVWDGNNVLPLVRTSSGTYEGTFYDFGWGGDVAFCVTWPGSGKTIRIPITNFSSAYLNPSNGDTSFLIPSGAGYYKVVVDLKEGINVSPEGTVTPKGQSKFTLNYISQ